jgi:hypothetical protein
MSELVDDLCAPGCVADLPAHDDSSEYLEWCGMNELLDAIEIEGLLELSNASP